MRTSFAALVLLLSVVTASAKDRPKPATECSRGSVLVGHTADGSPICRPGPKGLREQRADDHRLTSDPCARECAAANQCHARYGMDPRCEDPDHYCANCRRGRK